MSSPSTRSQRSPSPGQKRPSIKSRMGTIARRSTSFLKRSNSPAARPDPEDPMAKDVSSKPASIRSVSIQAEATQPTIESVSRGRQDVTRQEVSVPVETPPRASLEVPPSAPPAPAEPAPETRIVDSVSKPADESDARPVVPDQQPAEERNTEEPYQPVYVSTAETREIDTRNEPRPQPEQESEHKGQMQHQDQGISIPISESPKPISASLPHEDFRHNPGAGIPGTGMPTPRSAPSDDAHHPAPLSVKASRENLNHELSPIQEDERSALEEKRMPFTQPNGVPPGLSAPPAVGPSLSGATPRTMPFPTVVSEEHEPHVPEDKGKAKEVDNSMAHHDAVKNLPQEEYFSRSAPMTISHSSDDHYELEDPFKDPTPSTTHMPEPNTHGAYDVSGGHVAIQPVYPVPPAVSMPEPYPLPPLNAVTSGHLRSTSSDYTLGALNSRAPSVHNEVQTDETLPLLTAPKPAADGFNKCGAASYRDFQSAGWVAHSLPDSTTYYSHPAMRVTTDINLQWPSKLAAVMTYLEGKLAKGVSLPIDGLEIWLHDEAKSREDFVPVRCWVNHEARALGYWPPPSHRRESAHREHSDDKLDYEYRYWAFMETHPSHIPLPANAYAEAWDKLSWSYTDRLLKLNRKAPPPFTRNESQELLTLLRSTSGSESEVQSAIQTRVVARIHRRIVQWKQHFFRPEKPLPRGVGNVAHHNSNSGRKSFLDFVLAWLCLGIPYLYANRHVYRFDEEGGIMRSAGPILVVGATICIVAATILLAGIVFLALPGMDHISRTAGFITIIGSFASLGASLIAAFRNNFEIQRMAVRGGEGIVMISSTLTGNSILPSLPAVFLAWSILSLITGVVLYAFRGTVAVDTSVWTRFASFTRWTTLGVVGFCCGALIVSMFAIRR